MTFIKDMAGKGLNVALIESFVPNKVLRINTMVHVDAYEVTMASGAKHMVLPEEFKKVPVETP